MKSEIHYLEADGSNIDWGQQKEIRPVVDVT